MAILAPESTFEQFCSYTRSVRGEVSDTELDELWEWRKKLYGVRFDVGRGQRSRMPKDEQHLTKRERGEKAYVEAKSQGRNIERLPERSPYWI